MYFPCRGGVRGGADQFNWEDIKSDKFRENYLGHSVKAPVGRWQKGKDLAWYSKKDKGGNSARESFLALKAAEEEAMMAALGHRPIKKDCGQLTKEDIAEALKKGQIERSGLEVERIEGMGYMGARTYRAEKDGLSFQNNMETKTEAESPTYKSSLIFFHFSLADENSDHNRRSKSKRKSKKKSRHVSTSSSSDSDTVQSSQHISRSYKKSENSESRHSKSAKLSLESDSEKRSKSKRKSMAENASTVLQSYPKKHAHHKSGRKHRKQTDSSRTKSKKRRRHDSDS